MQPKHYLRGDRGSWTERAPEPGGKAERPGDSSAAERRPRHLIRAMPAKGDRPRRLLLCAVAGRLGVGETTIIPTQLHGAALPGQHGQRTDRRTAVYQGTSDEGPGRGGAVFPVLGRWQTRVMAGGDSGAGPGAGLGRRWDVALSFAGAQRAYVERVAA